jgi:hypothetical protein
MPSCIRDASPNAWGRRVLINREHRLRGVYAASIQLDELTYLLELGSDRIGARDFQLSPDHCVPRQAQQASFEDLLTAAEKVDRGVPLSSGLDLALQHGTSLGGACPKILIEDGNRKFIAKFSAYSAGLKIGEIVEISVRPLLWNTPPLSRLAGYGLAVGFVFYGRLVYFWRVSADKVP